ncbi:FecR domain-containing protein [Alphaproteobacteria bacterium]|nr:FecR domain-containing protein [Alphaproteobacteria bacterium]
MTIDYPFPQSRLLCRPDSVRIKGVFSAVTVLLLSVMLLLPTGIMPAKAASEVGVIQSLTGTVKIRSASAKRYMGKIGDVINRGDLIKTDGQSSLEIALNEGSLFTIAPNSTFIIDDFVMQDEAELTMGARLIDGAFSFASGTKKFAKVDRKVLMANATLTIRGTRLIGIADRRSQVVLLTGKIDLSTGAKSVSLNRRNQSVSYDSTGSIDPPVILSDEDLAELGRYVGLDIKPAEKMKGGRVGITRHVQPGCVVVGTNVICG